jgi:hypothetical protein
MSKINIQKKVVFMFKLYNSQLQISSDLSKFFKIIFPTISKPHHKIIPDIIIGMVKAESVVTTDIIKKIKDPWSDIQPASIVRKFERFFNNNKFMSYDFYNSIIKYIIKNYKLKNKNVYISFEHIKHYGYRFGSIEFIFKNQKSNGFYLESTKMRNIQSFTTLFTLVCVAILWLTILGADYSKNKNHFKNCFKIRYSKKIGSGNKRTFSLFNTGLFFFNLAFESTKYIVLKCNFILYDI